MQADLGQPDARRSLALAREIGDPVGELLARVELSMDADYVGDQDEAVRLARQAEQVAAGIPGPLGRSYSYVLAIMLANAGTWPKPSVSARGTGLGPGSGRPVGGTAVRGPAGAGT